MVQLRDVVTSTVNYCWAELQHSQFHQLLFLHRLMELTSIQIWEQLSA